MARARLDDSRLGKKLQGHDVLIPTHSDVVTSERQDVEPPKRPVEKEPTTVRFSRTVLKQLDILRASLHAEHALRVTRSDMIEAAVCAALKDVENLRRELQVLPLE